VPHGSGPPLGVQASAGEAESTGRHLPWGVGQHRWGAHASGVAGGRLRQVGRGWRRQHWSEAASSGGDGRRGGGENYLRGSGGRVGENLGLRFEMSSSSVTLGIFIG
jgi:hypothetical protein